MSSNKPLEEKLSEFQPAPSPRFYRRFSHAPWTPAGRLRRRASGGILAALLLAVILMAATPLGRAWAQEIIHFFTRAESDTLPLPTAEPSTATLPAALWGLSIAEAQELAGYDVTVPPSLPPGYGLEDVIYDPQTGAVIQHYAFSPYQAGEFFLLIQSPIISADVIGSSATVESLEIGGIPVEYVNGTWLTEAGSVTEQWIAGQPVNTFRWQSGDFYYTLQFWVDDTFSPAYLTRDDMVAMVEVVMGVRDAFPERLNYSNLTSLEQAREAADFEILVPEILPEGYAFGYASYDPGQRVVLIYTPEGASADSSNASLVIFESVATAGAEFSWEGYPEGMVETVAIGNTTGTFVRGAVVDEVYDPDFGVSLLWEANGLLINIQLRDPASLSPDLLRDLLIRIAESMR